MAARIVWEYDEMINWTKITDSRSSLPPCSLWILIAIDREGGVVTEAYFDGTRFHQRDGFTHYMSGVKPVIAWSRMPVYPKELR